MMESLTVEQIKVLAQQTASPSISIYLPTHRSGQDARHDPMRFKNLLREAEKEFLGGGMGPREVRALLQPAQALLEESNFWNHQNEGLVVFMTSEDFHSYRLPYKVEELLIIARSFYLKPVLPLLTNNGHYFILVISKNEVRLLEGTRYGVGQIDLPDATPGSLEAGLTLNDPQKQLQMHTGTSRSEAGHGMFHGQGSGGEERKARIEHYLNLVDAGLRKIYGEQQAPLVLAGVDYLLPLYRKVSDYPNIMPEGISGNPDHLRPEELQEQAWPIVEAYFRQETEKTLEQYRQSAGTDKAADDIEEIVAAAVNGRVDKLILSIETPVWGTFNPDTGKVILDSAGQAKPDNLALVDFAAMKTLQNGGTVYALSQEEMPSASPIAAVFRYPVL